MVFPVSHERGVAIRLALTDTTKVSVGNLPDGLSM